VKVIPRHNSQIKKALLFVFHHTHLVELLPQGLTEKFKEKDMSYSGSATFGYEAFMLTVLPFLIA
jgi:hypothetical protein